MKITTDPIATGTQAQSATQREITSQRFDEILTQAENRQSASVDKTSPSQPIFQISPVLLDPVNSDGLLQRLDKSLAQLESYQVRLSDPTIPVHELQLDIDRLEEQQNQLQSDLSNLADSHPMKGLLNRSVVAMTVEIEKYRRGDFA